MSVKVTAAGKLGWTSDENGYRYVESDPSGKPWPHMPDEWIEIADRTGDPEPWDSAIVNWYDEGASLGRHVDESEWQAQERKRLLRLVDLGDSAALEEL